MRLRWPPSRVIPTRVGSFDFGSSSITFEMWIGPSWCVTPPTSPARCASRIVRGRRWRVVMLRPSTKTRLFLGSTAFTVPVFPLSLPVITLTVSPFLILIAISRPPPRGRARAPSRGAGVGWWSAALEDLRGERDDLHEVAIAQLARDRAEDAGAARVVGGVDDHRGVLVEGDVGAVLAPELLAGAHDDRLDDLALLDRPLRVGGLDGGGDDIPDARVAAARAALDADAED